MKPINKSKLITAVLSSVAVLSMVGSVSGTVAWYQYSTRSSVSYSGASAKCTENLKVRLYRAPVEEDRAHGIEEVKEYKTEWKSDLRLADVQKFIADERNTEDYALRPVTSGELDENKVATEFYAQPKRYTAKTSDWGKATKMDYVELPLQFRVEDNNGNAATNREYLEKNLYLADLTMESKDVDGKKDITDALRVGVDATEDVTFSAHGEEVNVYSKLDLDGDGELDKMNDATGLDYDFDDQRAEIVYGDADKAAKSTKAVKANFGDTWVIDGADTKIEDHGNREGAYYKTAHKNEDAVEVYAFDDSVTAFHFAKIGDEYLALGADTHNIEFDGANWTIDGDPADVNYINVLNAEAPLYVLDNTETADLRIIEVTPNTYEVIQSDAPIAKTEGRFVVDGVATGLLVPADHEHDSYGVKAINEGAAKNVYEIVFWNDESVLFDQKVDDASPRGMTFDAIDDEANVSITRSNYEANRNRMLADDSDEDNVIGKPLGVTKAWTAADGAVGDDYWLSVTVRIYLEGWQELNPVAPDSAIKIASKSLTAAEIAVSDNHDKVYIASDDHKVYTYVTDEWVGAAADPDAVYEIDGFYYTYQAAGEVEISPADAGSRVFEAKGKKTVAELTALVDRKDGNSFINSETNKKYTWKADTAEWVVEDLVDEAAYKLGNEYYLYHADGDDEAIAQDVAEGNDNYFVAYGMKTTAELTALEETGPLANGDVYLTTANDKKYTWKDDGENPAGWIIEDLKAGDTYKLDDKYYAIKAGSFNVRPGGSIWDDKEYVGSAFNVGMTFAVDTY